MKAEWMGVEEVASLTAVTRRAATKLLARAATGKQWRGHVLEVREVHGRGGRSGLSYEVSLRSLSEALDEPLPPAWSSGPATPPEPRDIARNQWDVWRRRETAILPFVYLDPGSPERVAALDAQAKLTGYSTRSLNRWAALYDAYGVNGLANKKPATAGQRRVQVSRVFDDAFRAAGYQDELLAIIALETTQAIKGLWKSRREASGYNAVRRDAETLLEEACDKYGVTLPDAAFKLSRRRVEEFARFRIVNIYRNDRKKWDDNKPRIRRDWTGLKPMEVVVADVKPLDIIVTRPDGTTGWPRLIGFLDAATFRLFAHVVLCKPGESIRQEHVHEAFIAMAMHPEWGFPKSLYLDNGSEFGALDKLRDAMALLSEPGARTVIYARPYNASAKPIESAFARLDRLFTCIMPGYAGRDRMTKKTQTVGRPPQPYPHSFERFVEDMALGVEDVNHTPLLPKIWRGRSPAQVWRDAVDAGWRPVVVDPFVIDAALCTFETRIVGKGQSVQIGGKTYPVPDAHKGDTVSVALSWRRGAAPLYQPPGSPSWRRLEEDFALQAMWTQGASETTRRQRAAVRSLRQIEGAAPDIDPMEPARARARKRTRGFLPQPGPALDAGDELMAVADGFATADARQAISISEEERIRRARDATTRRLLRSQAHG